MDEGGSGLGPLGAFMGTYTPRLDEKGRLILPARFRPPLATGLVITRGYDRCIALFPVEQFRAVLDRLRGFPYEDRRARDLLRGLLAFAVDEVPDRQGRIPVSPALREYAGIDRDVAVVGQDTRIEVWNSATWHEYLAAHEDEYAGTGEGVVGTP